MVWRQCGTLMKLLAGGVLWRKHGNSGLVMSQNTSGWLHYTTRNDSTL